MRFALAMTLALAGCSMDATLVVQVRTDLVPRAELGAVEVDR